MSKNDNYVYPPFVMSNDINLGGWGVNQTFPTAPLVNIFKFKSILYLLKWTCYFYIFE
jgi:hypothetical protein